MERGSLSEDDEDGKREEPLTRSQITKRAVAMLLAGTLACAFFSDPMVSAVTNFSRVCFGASFPDSSHAAQCCQAIRR